MPQTPNNQSKLNSSDLEEVFFTSRVNGTLRTSKHSQLSNCINNPDSPTKGLFPNTSPLFNHSTSADSRSNLNTHATPLSSSTKVLSTVTSKPRILNFSSESESDFNIRTVPTGTKDTSPSQHVRLLTEKIKQLESINAALINKIDDLVSSGYSATNTVQHVPDICKTPAKCNLLFNRVFIFSDSMGRDMSHFLKEILPTSCNVSSLIKPGAKFSDVISSIPNLCHDFTPSDVIIIMGGSNDFQSCAPNSALNLSISKLSTLLSCTNIILHNIPYRFDQLAHLSTNIYETNQSFKLKAKLNENLHYFETNHLMERQHFTRHGLHYNRKGKKLLAKQIYKCLSKISLNFSDLPRVSPKQTTPHKSLVKLFSKTKTPESHSKASTLCTPKNKTTKPFEPPKLATPGKIKTKITRIGTTFNTSFNMKLRSSSKQPALTLGTAGNTCTNDPSTQTQPSLNFQLDKSSHVTHT